MESDGEEVEVREGEVKCRRWSREGEEGEEVCGSELVS